MPAQPLIDKFSILMLLYELADYGMTEEEVDIAIVRQGPVDLDLLQECKSLHPAFGKIRFPQKRPTRPRLS